MPSDGKEHRHDLLVSVVHPELGITHFVLSDTPHLQEIQRQGEQLLPLLR